jgi:hypothetical protein
MTQYTFTLDDYSDEVEVTSQGRHVATMLFADDGVLHDLNGTVPERAVGECMQNADALVNNGSFTTSV